MVIHSSIVQYFATLSLFVWRLWRCCVAFLVSPLWETLRISACDCKQGATLSDTANRWIWALQLGSVERVCEDRFHLTLFIVEELKSKCYCSGLVELGLIIHVGGPNPICNTLVKFLIFLPLSRSICMVDLAGFLCVVCSCFLYVSVRFGLVINWPLWTLSSPATWLLGYALGNPCDPSAAESCHRRWVNESDPGVHTGGSPVCSARILFKAKGPNLMWSFKASADAVQQILKAH